MAASFHPLVSLFEYGEVDFLVFLHVSEKNSGLAVIDNKKIKLAHVNQKWHGWIRTTSVT